MYLWKGRTDIQCKQRWQKHVDPDLAQSVWTKDEDDKVLFDSFSHITQTNIVLQIGLTFVMCSAVCFFFLADDWSGEQIWCKKLAFYCQTPEGADHKAVSRALAERPRSSGEEESLEHRGRHHPLQSSFAVRKPLDWDCQTAAWQVGELH